MFQGVNILNQKVKEKLTTENIFKIYNSFIIPLLSHEERDFMLELQRFCLEELEPSIDITHDVYELFPLLGQHGYMQRLYPYQDFKPDGMRYEMILAQNLSIVDPELDLARVVSGVLAMNPLYSYGATDRERQALEDLMSGQKTGCICITEKERGSDAVNMQTHVTECDDGTGDVFYDGEKVFTTNGPKADYFIAYGVTDEQDPRSTMYQVLIERGFEGLETNRLGVNSAPRVHIGQTVFNHVRVPAENIIGTAGAGYTNLFRGLVAERTTIIGSSLGISWLSVITALIYSDLRRQFDKRLLDFQAVSFPLAEMLVDLMAATDLGFKAASEFEKIARYPEHTDMVKYNASFSAGTKYLAAHLAHRISYESQQLVGGIGYTDNMRIDKALEVSKIQEIIGGSRNIQLLLVNQAIKTILKLID
ncbi:MAG TPA: acyl-CoA dehydrogenase family protein [Candidatus Lokiarchaeia archaeon]|nr:acyl-CoA dehydrogenase family protein [Candidatus Lokiarchaeia archaeon]